MASAYTIHDPDAVTVDLSPLGEFTIVDAFDGAPHELTVHYSHKEDVTRVEADTDGDTHANLVILIEGRHTDPSDYVL